MGVQTENRTMTDGTGQWRMRPAWLAALGALALLVAALAPGRAAAQGCPINSDICPPNPARAEFAALRGAIGQYVPGPAGTVLTRQAAFAEGLYFGEIELPPNPILPPSPIRAAATVLRALDLEVRGLGFLGAISPQGTTAIRSAIAALLARILPPNPI